MEPGLNAFDTIGPTMRHQVTQRGVGGLFNVRSNPVGGILDAIREFCFPSRMMEDGNGGYADVAEDGSVMQDDGTWGVTGYSGGGFEFPFSGGGQFGGNGMFCGDGTVWDQATMRCIPKMDDDDTMPPPPDACSYGAIDNALQDLEEAAVMCDRTAIAAIKNNAMSCRAATRDTDRPRSNRWKDVIDACDRTLMNIQGRCDGPPPPDMNCPTGQVWDPVTMMCKTSTQCPPGQVWNPTRMMCEPDMPPPPMRCNQANATQMRMGLTNAITAKDCDFIRVIEMQASECVRGLPDGDLRMRYRNIRDDARAALTDSCDKSMPMMPNPMLPGMSCMPGWHWENNGQQCEPDNILPPTPAEQMVIEQGCIANGGMYNPATYGCTGNVLCVRRRWSYPRKMCF